MNVDDFLGFLIDYGIYISLFLVLVNLLLSVWYKPHRLSFVFQSFFKIYPKITYSDRDMKNPKWPFFKKAHNTITILFYLYTGFWLLIQFGLVLSQIKPSKLSK